MAIDDILFRIFYSTSFTFAFLVLFAVCCVTPADTLYQSYKRRRFIDIFIITGAYVLTGLIAIFLYSSRLYTNRSVLRDIPKTFLPIDKDDLPNRRIWVLIQERLARAAVTAYHARPRARRIEVEHPLAGERILLATKQVKHSHHHHHHHQSYGHPEQLRLTEDEKKLLEPKWGEVQHPGWRSPAAKEMPGLEYVDVVNQLVDLVEANAVSLSSSAENDAPITATMTLANGDNGDNGDNDDDNDNREKKQNPKQKGKGKEKERVIDLVTRPEHFGMRQYMGWLARLGVVPDDSVTESFIRAYERARFAAQPLSTSEFDDLMRRFAELLRSMKPLEPGDLLDPHHDDGDGDGDGDSDGDGRDKDGIPQKSSSIGFLSPSSPYPPSYPPPSRISEDSAAPSMSEDEEDSNGNGNDNDNLPPRYTSQRKAAVPQPRKRNHAAPRRSSRKSPLQPPSPLPPTPHTESPASTRSRSTMTQGSNNGSVIRLRMRRRDGGDGGDDDDDDDNNNNNNNNDDDDDNDEGNGLLPYTIEVGGRMWNQGKSNNR